LPSLDSEMGKKMLKMLKEKTKQNSN